MAIQNSNLPPSFVNEVVKIVEDETIVRSDLKSVSDVYSWIEEYGRTSDTKWNLRSSRASGSGFVCWNGVVKNMGERFLRDVTSCRKAAKYPSCSNDESLPLCSELCSQCKLVS
ncbi:hypothetical protein AVEN_14933-1 [Araneus ventricosus]|uniref:Uncharacterized protein n=1 Tax=Araneus ventricosus TaxID=182803 RepID=A0A4Y2U4N5_ARAVE|nr:hypothetical protein AVEN_14933-1 [Araneus ventricosus]